jgi:hypothetical protein
LNVFFAVWKMVSADDSCGLGAEIDRMYCCGPCQVCTVNSSMVTSMMLPPAVGCHQNVHRAAGQPSNFVPEIGDTRWYRRYLPVALALAWSRRACRTGALTTHVDMLTPSLPGPEVGLITVFGPGVTTHEAGPASRNPASACA